MIEHETFLDALLAETISVENAATAQQIDRLAAGDFRDPADAQLDKPLFRMRIFQRRLGRTG